MGEGWKQQAVAAEKSIPSEPRHAARSEETLPEAVQRVFRTLERQLGAAGKIRAQYKKWKGSRGNEWVYARSRGKAKMEIPI